LFVDAICNWKSWNFLHQIWIYTLKVIIKNQEFKIHNITSILCCLLLTSNLKSFACSELRIYELKKFNLNSNVISIHVLFRFIKSKLVQNLGILASNSAFLYINFVFLVQKYLSTANNGGNLYKHFFVKIMQNNFTRTDKEECRECFCRK